MTAITLPTQTYLPELTPTRPAQQVRFRADRKKHHSRLKILATGLGITGLVAGGFLLGPEAIQKAEELASSLGIQGERGFAELAATEGTFANNWMQARGQVLNILGLNVEANAIRAAQDEVNRAAAEFGRNSPEFFQAQANLDRLMEQTTFAGNAPDVVNAEIEAQSRMAEQQNTAQVARVNRVAGDVNQAERQLASAITDFGPRSEEALNAYGELYQAQDVAAEVLPPAAELVEPQAANVTARIQSAEEAARQAISTTGRNSAPHIRAEAELSNLRSELSAQTATNATGNIEARIANAEQNLQEVASRFGENSPEYFQAQELLSNRQQEAAALAASQPPPLQSAPASNTPAYNPPPATPTPFQ